MIARRVSRWFLFVAVAAVGMLGCEPYMSMTDQIPAQSRQAAALLPESPRFVGMVDVQDAMDKVDRLSRAAQLDSLRAADSEPLRAFLETTGLNPREDVRAAYAATEEDDFTAVLFVDLTQEQIDRYLDEAPEEAGRVATYRDVSVYHLQFGPEWESESHTLSLAFIDNGTVAAASGADRIEAVVDRYRDERDRLQDNEEYMRLVERVGRGSTGWLVGSNVIEDAIGDSTGLMASADTTAQGQSPSMAQAGIQGAIVEWSNRVLGLSEMSSGVSNLGGEAMGKVQDLKEKVRRQALSITLTETSIEGEVYLSMMDDAEANSVVEMARGGIAFLRFSRNKVQGTQKALLDDFLEEADIERDGALVHLQFSIARDHFGEDGLAVGGAGDGVRRFQSDARPANVATRRLAGIMHARTQL